VVERTVAETVAIVERLKRWHELARLRRAARRSPAPASYGELAEKLISLGETGEALRTAEEGLSLFPDSERLDHVRAYARKGPLAGQIRTLREELATRPSPLAYARLAQIYRELGSHDDALATAADCAARFPLNETSHLVQGEIRVERFRRDMVARDATTADQALTKVVRLNPQNVAARMLLAEIHWLVGDARGCREHLRPALAISPSAEGVREFLDELDASAAAESDDPPSFESLAYDVESVRAFANDPSRFPAAAARDAGAGAEPRSGVDAARVRRAMAALGEHAGMRNAVLLDQDGASLAEFAGADGLAPARFVELVKGVRDVADDAGRRMDAGALVRVEIEGPGGNVTVTRARGLTVALLYAAPLRVERACEVVQDFLARTLASPPGGARA